MPGKIAATGKTLLNAIALLLFLLCGNTGKQAIAGKNHRFAAVWYIVLHWQPLQSKTARPGATPLISSIYRLSVYVAVGPILSLLHLFYNIFAENQLFMSMHIPGPIAVYDEEEELYGTKVGLDNAEMTLILTAWGKTEADSIENAKTLAFILNGNAEVS